MKTWDDVSNAIARWIIGDKVYFAQALEIARTKPSMELKAFLIPLIEAGATPEAAVVRDKVPASALQQRIVWSYVAIDIVMAAPEE